jgi:hypothetical protein
MEPKTLLDEARRLTGLDDFGDDSFREPMERLIASINAESQLSEFGQAAAPAMMIGRLSNRLQIENWYKRHPEIEEQEIVQPLFISGLPRTGTTALGHMLALDPATRSLRSWEAGQPCPPPDAATQHDDPRLAASRARAEQFDRIAPGLRDALPRSSVAPDECFSLLDLSFISFASDGYFHVPSYVDWLMRHSELLEPAYAYHRRVLKLLQWRCPPRRWQLRTPVHMYAMDALLKTYPDARFVMTHRDPVKAMPSIASLMNMLRRAFLADPEPKALGLELLKNWSQGVQRMVAFRDRVGEGRFFDIAHGDQARDPLPQIRRLYAWMGWTFTPELEASVLGWCGDNPKGDHRPDAAHFGIEADATRKAFAGYMERYGGLFG